MALSEEQIAAFRRDGAVVVPDAVSPAQLRALRADFAAWEAESRAADAPYGSCVDGRPRFDLEPAAGETPAALRRVNAPADISEAYFDVLTNSAMVDMVADLIGPDVRHHHNKINAKRPGAGTAVKWHQDFLFTPHSNSDLVTALLMVDEVTDENGPLEIAPGSHRGPLHSLWREDRFTGAVAPETAEAMQASARRCAGPAGAVCLMHTRLAHGSAPNRSAHPRTLFIAVYAAADAAPLAPNPVPNRHEGLLVRGSEPGRLRSESFEMRPPEYPRGASFFGQQARADAR